MVGNSKQRFKSVHKRGWYKVLLAIKCRRPLGVSLDVAACPNHKQNDWWPP